MEILQLFISRPDSALHLLEIWKKLDDEDYPTIMRWFDRIQDDYHAVDPANVDFRAFAAQFRGRMRIIVLRIIASLSYADSMSDKDLSCLVGLVCGQFQGKPPVPPPANPRAFPAHLFDSLERNELLSIKSLISITVEPMVVDDAVLQGPPRDLVGPIAFFRLLICFTKRRIVEEVSTWTSVPLPEHLRYLADLSEIKRIADPDVIQERLSFAVEKVATGRKKANEVVDTTRDSAFHARGEYRHVAELAANLIAYNRASGDNWSEHIRGIWKELVFSVGNAAEMSVRLQEYETALSFATITVDVAHSAPEGEKVSDEVLAKNMRRLNEAQRRVSSS